MVRLLVLKDLRGLHHPNQGEGGKNKTALERQREEWKLMAGRGMTAAQESSGGSQGQADSPYWDGDASIFWLTFGFFSSASVPSLSLLSTRPGKRKQSVTHRGTLE